VKCNGLSKRVFIIRSLLLTVYGCFAYHIFHIILVLFYIVVCLYASVQVCKLCIILIVMLCILIFMLIYSYCYVCSVLCILFHCAVLCTVCVLMCTTLLPPGVNPIEVSKYKIYYIASYHISYHP
jgi:hypothetical protein